MWELPLWSTHSTVHITVCFLLSNLVLGLSIGSFCSNVLSVPPRLVLLCSRHAGRGLPNRDSALLDCRLEPGLPFYRPITSSPPPSHIALVRVQHHAPLLCVPLGAIDFSLNGCEEIVVVVNARWCCEISFFDIGSWIASSATLSPLFVAFCAGKGTCAGGAARTTVFWGGDVTAISQ